jgi:hypothetical protein
MNDTRVNASAPTPSQQRDSTTASHLAESILSTNGRGNVRDVEGIKRELDQLQARNPELAALVRPIVMQGLTPVERGQLAAANDRGVLTAAQTVTGPDNRPILLSPDGPTVAQHFASPAGSPGRELYNRFDRLFGDGNPATNDVARIDAALTELVRNGQSLEQAEAAASARQGDPAQAAASGIDARLAADVLQVGLDVVGIFEPTPFADLTNAGISLTRGIYDGITNGSVWDAVAGVGDAAISVAGVFPGIGDTAKLLRLGRHADTVARAIAAVAGNEALRSTFAPGLRAIKETLDNVSPTVIDALPQGAADSIRAMKTQLDEFFGAAPVRADGAPRAPFLSATDFASLPRTGRIDPNSVRFSQDSASASFRPPNGSIDDFVAGLRSGTIDPTSVAPVRIVERDGMIYTLDNRRLEAFQRAGIDIPYEKLDSIPRSELFKFTTTNGGESIRIRGSGNQQ